MLVAAESVGMALVRISWTTWAGGQPSSALLVRAWRSPRAPSASTQAWAQGNPLSQSMLMGACRVSRVLNGGARDVPFLIALTRSYTAAAPLLAYRDGAHVRRPSRRPLSSRVSATLLARFALIPFAVDGARNRHVAVAAVLWSSALRVGRPMASRACGRRSPASFRAWGEA